MAGASHRRERVLLVAYPTASDRTVGAIPQAQDRYRLTRTSKRIVLNPQGKKRTMSLTRAVILAALPATAWEGPESP